MKQMFYSISEQDYTALRANLEELESVASELEAILHPTLSTKLQIGIVRVRSALQSVDQQARQHRQPGDGF